jgi:hypothetical protein
VVVVMALLVVIAVLVVMVVLVTGERYHRSVVATATGSAHINSLPS